jgi:two-component system sensor histidine kinase PilS (NtrC family)
MKPDTANRNFSGITDELPNWLKQALLSPLSLYQFYRIFLLLILTGSFATHSGPAWLGFFAPKLFLIAIFAYWGLISASLILQISRKLPVDIIIGLIILSDIVVIAILMHASGGITNGMGLLLAISVTAGSLLMRGRLSLLFAAIATLAVLTEQFSEFLFQKRQDTALFEAALLSLAFFAIALLSHSLYQNFRRSEEKAQLALQALDQMANINAHVIDMIQLGILVVEQDGKVLLINQKFREWLSISDLKGNLQLASASPELSAMLTEFIDSKKISCQLPLEIKPDNHTKSLMLQFRYPGQTEKQIILISAEAMNEVEERAQQMKLASLGRLTASIAHEIRNPLSSIRYASQLLSESEGISTSENRLTEIISTNTVRLNQIIENVLQLSRQKKPEPEVIDIAEWIKLFTEKHNDTELSTPISLTIEPENLPFTISVDPSQFEQILSIILHNSKVHFDRHPEALKIDIHCLLEKQFVKIQIIDNGPGISVEHQKHLFEPFFTTRHEGTGLGLHLAREMMQLNRGDILFNNMKPHGSIFTLNFPLITATSNQQDHD